MLYVTERAVFALGKEGLKLVELAPGVDLDADVLGQMAFTPTPTQSPPTMDPRIFGPGPMGLETRKEGDR